MDPPPGFKWTVLVLTCQHTDSVAAFQRELEQRQRRGSVSSDTVLLTVPDPGERLGSGGATLNALLVAAEHLSARAGHTVLTSEVLQEALILILHTGRAFPWGGCSRAFCWLEEQQHVQGPVCCLDLLLVCLNTKLCPGCPPGVWVCSTDMILSLPEHHSVCWEGFQGVRMLALPGDVSYAANHGVLLTGDKGNVRDIVYMGTTEQILQAATPDGQVPLVCGVVFFSQLVAVQLLQALVTAPLDGCTYLGTDSGAPPLQVSLFLDIVKCLCEDVTRDDFIHQERRGCSSPAGPGGAAVRSGRAELWRALRGTPLSMEYVQGGCYDYLSLSGWEHIRRLLEGKHNSTLSHIQRLGVVGGACRVIGSVLQGEVTVASGAAVQHCHLQGPLLVPSGCMLSGLPLAASQPIRALQLSSDIIIQGHRLRLGETKLLVFSVLGAHDQLEVCWDSSSFLNLSWHLLFSRTGIRPEDLWVGGGGACSLLEARLFPVLQERGGAVGLEGGVAWLLGGGASGLEAWQRAWRLSLRELLSLTDQEAELLWREELMFLAGRRRVTDALSSQSEACLLPCFRAAVLGGQQGALLETLDTLAAGPGGGASRCLSCIADVLVCVAGEGRGGLRSGPAANQAWRPAFSLLEEGDRPGGVALLAQEREHWMDRPELLVRAARHYEGAGQVLLRQAVMSSQKFVSISKGEAPPLQEWQEVECPARLDLAGGWSDTPPLAFDHGGSVTNVAVRVDGQRPIGARARLIPQPLLLLVEHGGGRDSPVAMEMVCKGLDDLRDCCQPHAPGALLKAVCVYSGLVSLDSQNPLPDQLLQRWGGGLEIHSWSDLPHGSGLGTSSILAGALLAVVYRSTGRTINTHSLIHAVLNLEQMLTTGGGWQDQVGGLVGGVKVGRSKAQLPLQVEVERLNPPAHFLSALEEHLLLVYTGKTRLARNLLQDVVRSWYSRLPSMVSTVKQLVVNSEDCSAACTQGSLEALGRCLDRSWEQKRRVAPGCEPPSVHRMMEALRPLALGQSLAGAGGGGFLCLLSRLPRQQEAVRHTLHALGVGDVSVHTVEIDVEGLVVHLHPSEHAGGDMTSGQMSGDVG